MIDNYDSFTYNLVQYFRELGEQVVVYRNDVISCEMITQIKPERIVISPGPGTPDDAGICLQLVEKFKGKVPILGVCLGHQVIAQAFGAKIVKAEEILHGKTSVVQHLGKGLFEGLSTTFPVARYHSLVVEEGGLSSELEVDAWSQGINNTGRTIMSILHKKYKLFGIQFHPESILTENGHKLLKNFIIQK